VSLRTDSFEEYWRAEEEMLMIFFESLSIGLQILTIGNNDESRLLPSDMWPNELILSEHRMQRVDTNLNVS
jgi:hypothetical protein